MLAFLTPHKIIFADFLNLKNLLLGLDAQEKPHKENKLYLFLSFAEVQKK